MDSEIISKNILNLRKSLKLTQAEFAKKLHITYQAVSKWENGQSIPDITTLNYICKTFNVDLNELINGTKKKELKNKPLIIILIIIWILAIILLVYTLLNHHQSFEFKTISSSCSAFNITGSAAYNNNKTSIYISNIDYCGGDDNTIYSNIECNLYSSDDLITSCNIDKNNTTLADYLKEVKINIDNKSCPSLTNSSLYLNINAIDKNNQTINYKIPLSLNSNCD